MRFFTTLFIVLVMLTLSSLACTKSTPAPAGQTPSPQTSPGPSHEPTVVPADGGASTARQDIYGNTSPSGQSSPPPDAGSTTVAGKLPAEWPADIPLMKDLTVITSVVVQGPPKIINVSTSGPVSPDDVIAYYSVLPGWTKDEEVPWRTAGDERMMKMVKGNEHLAVAIQRKDNVTNVNLLYTIRLTSSPGGIA